MQVLSYYPVTEEKNANFYFLPLTLIWSVMQRCKRSFAQSALVDCVDVTLLVKTLCVKKLRFADPLISSLYNPKMQHWLWGCCCACTDAGGLPLVEAFRCVWVDLREDGNREQVVSKTKPILCSKSPSATKIDLSMEKVGFLSLSCYVQSDSARYQGTMLGYIRLRWAFVAFVFSC